eukprot:g14195.t1
MKRSFEHTSATNNQGKVEVEEGESQDQGDSVQHETALQELVVVKAENSSLKKKIETLQHDDKEAQRIVNDALKSLDVERSLKFTAQRESIQSKATIAELQGKLTEVSDEAAALL